MKVVDQKVWLQDQEPGWIGMMKHIELVGRVSWKSEDKITEDSWKKFIKFIYERGHWSVFNLGTAYLKVPIAKEGKIGEVLTKLYKEPWTKMVEEGGYVYVTTNFRVLCQLKVPEWVWEYWCEFDPKHFTRRVTVGWVCSRVISEEILRHACLRPIKESTRYINYAKREGIYFIIPQYAYQLRDELSETIDSLTGEDRKYLKKMEGPDLWRELTILSRWAASRDKIWEDMEHEYYIEISEDEVTPEVARGVLGLDLGCMFYTTGYLEDFFYEPPKDSPEKAGFFKLRCDKSAHLDLRVMAEELKEKMIERGYDKEWENSKMSVV